MGQSERRPLEGVELLLVEDSLELRVLLEWFLVECGARVRTQGSYKGALSEIAFQWPCAIVCDIELPDGDGRELLQFIRKSETSQKRTPMPAVAYTSLVDPSEVYKIWNSGFDAYIAKSAPASFRELAATLMRLC